MKTKTIVAIVGALLGILIVFVVVKGIYQSSNVEEVISSEVPKKKGLPESYTISYKNSLLPQFPDTQTLIFHVQEGNRRHDQTVSPPGLPNNFIENKFYFIEGKRYSCVDQGKKEWVCEDNGGFPTDFFSNKPPLSEYIFTEQGKDGVVISPIASERILGLKARCFEYEFPSKKESYCLHPDNNLILRTEYFITKDISVDPISPSVFMLPVPPTKLPPDFIMYNEF